MQRHVILLTVLLYFSGITTGICSNTQTTATIAKLDANVIASEINNFLQTKLSEEYTGEIATELLQRDFGRYLQPCSLPLDYSMSDYALISTRGTVKVTCAADKPWTMYVPVKIKIYQPVVIINTPMSKDEVITAANISVKNTDIINLHNGFFTDPDMVIGHVMRLSTKAGSIVTPRLIAKYKLVKRGDRVNIALEDPELTISMQGESLEDGGLGDNIKVRNNSSKKIIEATIVAPGKVQVHI